MRRSWILAAVVALVWALGSPGAEAVFGCNASGPAVTDTPIYADGDPTSGMSVGLQDDQGYVQVDGSVDDGFTLHGAHYDLLLNGSVHLFVDDEPDPWYIREDDPDTTNADETLVVEPFVRGVARVCVAEGTHAFVDEGAPFPPEPIL